jgi:hypothetical protein
VLETTSSSYMAPAKPIGAQSGGLRRNQARRKEAKLSQYHRTGLGGTREHRAHWSWRIHLVVSEMARVHGGNASGVNLISLAIVAGVLLS